MKIGVVGAAGRMGQMLIKEIAATDGAQLMGAAERPGHAALGKDAGTVAGLDANGIAIGADAAALFKTCQAVIDFTAPAATVLNAQLAAQHKSALVIGTTGLDKAQGAAIEAAAKTAPIVWAPNMSLGVNVLFAITEQVARMLGPDYDIEIVEMHHRHKVDAPSGTALGLGQAAAKGRGVELDKVAARGRDGITGARKRGDIGFAALRGGDVVGDHNVIFAADGERIELGHKASGRHVFAKGAVRASMWVAGKPPGLYSMKDVLGL
ncbi:MAG: 4-hydroxy-tetrahydrodipicolinate reductase [Alphaproteobacteria bacterium]